MNRQRRLARFLALVRAGASRDEIARQMNVKASTVSGYARQFLGSFGQSGANMEQVRATLKILDGDLSDVV